MIVFNTINYIFCVLIKRTLGLGLISQKSTKFEYLNTSNADLEMQWITIDLDNVRPIIEVNVYRPPQGSYKTASKLINEAYEKANLKDNTDIFILGDFNINFKDTP